MTSFSCMFVCLYTDIDAYLPGTARFVVSRVAAHETHGRLEVTRVVAVAGAVTVVASENTVHTKYSML